MKVLLIGAGGQLGTDLCKELKSFDLVPLLHSDIDVVDPLSVNNAFEHHRPDIVINTAAFHKVDECEKDPDKAFSVNAIGARNVAVSAERIGAKMVFISTDYVFGGDEKHTVPYTEFDAIAPVNAYGRSKAAGEEFVKHLCHRHFIVRVSSLFGVAGASGKGGNFVESIIKLARERGEVRVVSDQVFSPTYTIEAAKKIAQLITTRDYGTFHVTNQGVCSWFEFAREIIRLAGIEARSFPISASEHPGPAKRPAYSVLDNYHLKLIGLYDNRTWQESLKAYLREKGHLKHPAQS